MQQLHAFAFGTLFAIYGSVSHAQTTAKADEATAKPKPNVALVAKKGGGYRSPIAAIRNIEEWCEIGTSVCDLTIGVGEFVLSRSLVLPPAIKSLRGAGERRTVLRAAPNVAVALQVDGATVSDLWVMNSSNASSAVGIRLRSGKLSAIGVILNNAPSVTGIECRSSESDVQLDDVRIVAFASTPVGTAVGVDSTGFTARQLSMSIRGDASAVGIRDHGLDSLTTISGLDLGVVAQNAIGLQLGSEAGFISLSGGRIAAVGGSESVGLSAGNYNQNVRLENLRLEASSSLGSAIGIRAATFRGATVAVHDSVVAAFSNGTGTGIALESGDGTSASFLDVVNSTVQGNQVGVGAAESAGEQTEVRIHGSRISGSTALRSDQNWRFSVGTSKLSGLVNPGTGAIKCALVYDASYAPYIDECP